MADTPTAPGALATLLQREEGVRDEAAVALKQAQDRLAQAQAQLEMLQAHRSAYLTRWSAEFGRATTPQVYQCYRDFKARLEQAIAQQQGTLGHREAAVERARAGLVAAEQRAAAVRKLLERRLAEHRRDEARRERKREDEFARHSGWPDRAQHGLAEHDGA
ncbi:MAG: flagellar export protein FliJ [Rubrivivax sp.]